MERWSTENPDRPIRHGDQFSFRRTFTDADLSLFCGLTGDFNPFHIDDTFAAEGRFGARILPGLLTASMMTHIGGMLGMLASEMHFEFLAPVFIGETIACTVTIEAIDERGVVRASAAFVNAEGDDVLSAGFTGKAAHPRLAR